MDINNSLASGLSAFAEQFRAQVRSSGLPDYENAIHFCLALGLQAAWELPPGAIVFERPSRKGSRTDLWVREPHDLAIEVKYLRSSSAYTMNYGQALADFNKVAQVSCRLRLVVVVASERFVSHIKRSGRSLLPLNVGDSTLVTNSSLDRLSDTAREHARTHGQWVDLHISLLWSCEAGGCSLFAWKVIPETEVGLPF